MKISRNYHKKQSPLRNVGQHLFSVRARTPKGAISLFPDTISSSSRPAERLRSSGVSRVTFQQDMLGTHSKRSARRGSDTDVQASGSTPPELL